MAFTTTESSTSNGLQPFGDSIYSFKMLGYSASGLRSGNKVLFFLEGSDFTVQSLRNRLGDFSEALHKGISYYAARLGHAFSASIATAQVFSNISASLTVRSNLKNTT